VFGLEAVEEIEKCLKELESAIENFESRTSKRVRDSIASTIYNFHFSFFNFDFKLIDGLGFH
jgi:hypothetical protein